MTCHACRTFSRRFAFSRLLSSTVRGSSALAADAQNERASDKNTFKAETFGVEESIADAPLVPVKQASWETMTAVSMFIRRADRNTRVRCRWA